MLPPSGPLGPPRVHDEDPRAPRFPGLRAPTSGLGDRLDALLSGQEGIATPRPVLQEILTDLSRLHGSEPASAGAVVDFDPGLPFMSAPENFLRPLLENLVAAGLAGNESARPFCHVGVAHEDADSVTLLVRDNGPPLPECQIEDLRRYLRRNPVAPIPDRVYRLLLAQNLASWIGGTISLAPSAGDRGSTVLVRIPKPATS